MRESRSSVRLSRRRLNWTIQSITSLSVCKWNLTEKSSCRSKLRISKFSLSPTYTWSSTNFSCPECRSTELTLKTSRTLTIPIGAMLQRWRSAARYSKVSCASKTSPTTRRQSRAKETLVLPLSVKRWTTLKRSFSSNRSSPRMAPKDLSKVPPQQLIAVAPTNWCRFQYQISALSSAEHLTSTEKTSSKFVRERWCHLSPYSITNKISLSLSS